jgi:L-seryl-tRNA(Ser) seleniumtransferase
MKRALRMSKLPLAALEATLRLYLRPGALAATLPTLRLLTRPLADIRAMADDALQCAWPGRSSTALRVRWWPAGPDRLGLAAGRTPGSRPGWRWRRDRKAARPRAGRTGRRAARAAGAGDRPHADDRLLLDLRCLDDGAEFIAQLPLLRCADGH